MAPTICGLTLPMSTIRAMSTVSASVTRRPLRNSVTLPSRAMSSLICGPPPCTTTGRMPTSAHEHDVLGEQGERVVLGRRPPSRCRRTSPPRPAPRTAGCTAAPRRAPRPSATRRRSRRHRHLLQAGGLGQAERDVRGLHRAAACTLGEVVDRGEGDDGVRTRVEPGGDVHRVGAERRLGGRRPLGRPP